MFGTLPFRRAANGAVIDPRSLGKPAARFPASIATDSDLMVAVDRQQTNLAATLNTGDLSMTVTDASMITAYNLLSIDNEIVKTTGPPTGGVVPIQRGFDGTTPAIHLSGAAVSGFIDAWHHNALVSEVEAIEQALGVNLSRIPAVPFLVSTNFEFPPQQPGGSLIAGNNSITLTPVPQGINGTDQNHYVYISGGTGAPEAALITGGTAVAGAASGTLFVNCANAHSGAWTMATATAGIEEAIVTLGAGGGLIYVPAGSYTVTGPIVINQGNVSIVGASGASILNTSYTAGPVIDIYNSTTVKGGNHLQGLWILGPNSGSNYAIRLNNQNSTVIRDLYIGYMASGIQMVGSQLYRVLIDNVNVSYFTGTAISIEAGGEQILSRIAINGGSVATTTGISITNASGVWISDTDITVCNNGMLINPDGGASVLYLFVRDSSFDTCSECAILINPGAAGTVRSAHFVNCWTASSTGSGGVGLNGSGVALGSAGVIDGVRFIGHRSVNNSTQGMVVFGGTNIRIDASVFAGNGVIGGSPGVFIQPGISGWSISNSTFGQSDGFGNTQSYGIAIAAGASNHFRIQGNTFTANTSGPILDQSTGLNKIIANNLGISDVIAVVASAATVTLPLGETNSITGTAAITTINGGWTGRMVRLIKTDAGTVAIGGGGNVPGTYSLAQNGALTLTFDGTNWH